MQYLPLSPAKFQIIIYHTAGERSRGKFIKHVNLPTTLYCVFTLVDVSCKGWLQTPLHSRQFTRWINIYSIYYHLYTSTRGPPTICLPGQQSKPDIWTLVVITWEKTGKTSLGIGSSSSSSSCSYVFATQRPASFSIPPTTLSDWLDFTQVKFPAPVSWTESNVNAERRQAGDQWNSLRLEGQKCFQSYKKSSSVDGARQQSQSCGLFRQWR